MERIVYILGAGFSAPLGLPTMANFVDMARKLDGQNPTIGKVIDCISSMNDHFFKINVFDVEEVLSVLQMNHVLGKSFQTHITDIDMREFIKAVIVQSMPKLPIKPVPNEPRTRPFRVFEKLGWTLEYYGFFVASLFMQSIDWGPSTDPNNQGYQAKFKDSSKPPVRYSVITLNYDTVLEDFLKLISSARLPSNDGQNALRFVDRYIEDPLVDRCSLSLIKLHGSVDKGEITPMTWNKTISETDPPSALVEAFKILKSAQQIRILGYSLPQSDTYLKYLLKAATLNARSLSSIDVLGYNDNHSEEVRSRYHAIIGDRKARWKSGDVEGYLKNNYDIVMQQSSASEYSVACNRLESSHQNYFSGNELIGG